MGSLSSHKGWKEQHFFVHPPSPFAFLSTWLHALPPQPSLDRYCEGGEYRVITLLLEEEQFQLGKLLTEQTLALVGLSLLLPNPSTTLGRTPIYFFHIKIMNTSFSDTCLQSFLYYL